MESQPDKQQNRPKKRYRNLYVMELEGNGYSYYVGHTSKTQNAIFNEHLKGGRGLTKHNKPIKIIEWIPIGLIEEHEGHHKSYEKIIEYMERYGVREVRGGGIFCSVSLEMHLRAVAIFVGSDSKKYFNIWQQLKEYPELESIMDRFDRLRELGYLN